MGYAKCIAHFLFLKRLDKTCGLNRGDPHNGIAPGTSFEDLSNDWVCPGYHSFSCEVGHSRAHPGICHVDLSLLPWGCPPIEVRLRFSPDITWRVKESVWHPSQTLQNLPDGGCILTVNVSNPIEMKPWIRGWGPECEVLAPEGLRKEIAEEARRMAEVYRG